MVRIALPIVTFAFVLLVGIPTNAAAQGAQPCSTADEPQTPTYVQALFYPKKPGIPGTFRYRDLELQWDALYDLSPTVGLSETDVGTLNRLGITFAELPGHNPLGANLSDIQLIHEYFRAETTPAYNTDPFASSGIVVGSPQSYPRCSPFPCPGLSTTPPFDRGHLDHYLYRPGHQYTYAQYPSEFVAAKEDSSTGWWLSDQNWTAWFTNTIMTHGPADPSPASRTDLDGTGWARPNGPANVAFCHEFQHSMPKGGPVSSALDEIFGLGAEAIAGNPLPPSAFDVSYPFGLISNIQQQHKWMFASYLAYQFRGIDTTATLDGFQDDLLFRWAKGDRHLYALRPLLSDSLCVECTPARKPYFHPGGVPLDDHSRLQLLLHNWRVANFVNSVTLDQGQYGYPPQFGFTPKDNAGAWQDRDGLISNNVHAIPPEVVARPAWALSETTMVGTRYSSAAVRGLPDYAFPMSFDMFGSEYWVVRADPSLGATTRDLTVRISPERIWRCTLSEPPGPQDARLMASVVGYSVPAESLSSAPLWAHPEWAMQAQPPIWVDVDSVAGGLEFVLPGFGTTLNAAVVVISLGDGPSGTLSALGFQGFSQALPYRLNLALRPAPYEGPNPAPLLADANEIDESPTWSPTGTEVAFVRRNLTTGVSGIYRISLDGSPPVLLGPTGTENRSEPDWSPRGDWIAFVRGASAGSTDTHIWTVNRWTAELRQLTTGLGSNDGSPVFEPNGQRIAYLRFIPGQQPGPETLVPQQLRRMNLDGTGDVLLAEFVLPLVAGSLRWTSDGRFLYFAHEGTVFAVPADGGVPVARPSLIAGPVNFDFHPGAGRILAEQSGVLTSQRCPTQPGLSFRRIALRDTLLNDTQASFYRTGAEFYRPRWSPDGLRIAYSSNQNTANLSTDRDLFVGQVSYNQAPQFQYPNDYAVNPSQTFQMSLFATDPDGEALAYEMPAAYLPPGSSFNPSTRLFTWPSPGPQGSSHFVVVRALDPSGGVASRVVKLTVKLNAIDDLGIELVSNNAAWPVWTAPGEGSFQGVEYDLRYAPFPISDYNFTVANRKFPMSPPGPPGDPEEAGVGGLTPSTQYWFAIKTKDANGHWSAISNVTWVTTLSQGGGGFRAQERGPGLAGRVLGETDRTIAALIVEMGLDQGAPVWTLRQLGAEDALALGANDSVSVLYQRRDQAGDWVTRGRILAADADWRFGVRAFRRPGRLVFFGPYGVRQAWSSVATDRSDTRASLATAQHSRLGAVEGTFDSTGGASLEVTSGDTLVLAYQGIADEGPVAPWFLLVGPPGSEVTAPAFVRPEIKGTTTKLPTAFALRQNQPNPFSAATVIRFDLPVQTTVRLAVFDLLGRRIATLAEGSFPAGFHTVPWDRRDATGARAKPGIYLYRLEAGAFCDQKKMTVFPS